MRSAPPLLTAAVIAGLVASAQAATPVIYTNVSNLLPNTANQTVKVYVSGTDAIQGENLDFQINTATSGPFLTGVDIIAGTIFATNNTGQTVPNDTVNFNSQGILITGTASRHLAVVSTITASGSVVDNGLLATLTISTTATTGTAFTLSLLNTINGNSNFGTGGNSTISFSYPHSQLSIAATPDRQWKTNGGGAWNTDTNWSPFAPYAQGDSATFGGSLTSGTAIVTLDGVRTVGTLTFNDTAGMYSLQPGTGGSLLLDNGTQTAVITSQAGRHAIDAPIALTAASSVAVASGSTLTISGAISGASAALSLSGAGKLVLTGSANSYGATNIAAGASLQVGSGTQSGSLGTAAITNAGTVTFSRLAMPLTVPLSGSGTFVVDGFFVLNNTSTAASMIITTTGVLQIGNGGTTGLLAGGAVTNSGILTFNRIDAATHLSPINGAGTLTQIGTGTTTLSGLANYTGPTILSAGKLSFAGGLAHAIGVVSGAGSLQVSAGTSVTSDGINLSAAGGLIINGTQVIRSSASGGAYGTHIAGNDAANLSGTSEVFSLVFGATGILDLKNNGLIVQATAGTKASLLQQITGDVTGGFITSSTAATDPNYGVVVMDNADLGLTKFGGLAVDSNSILVVEALKGDTDFNGIIDGADFDRWFGNNGSTGVYSAGRGDLDGNGIVDGADFDIWFGHNGLTAGVVPSSSDGGNLAGGAGLGGSPVPEPASLACLGVGALVLLGGRRRRAGSSRAP